MVFSLGEFFCGPGGIALGAKLASGVSSDKGERFSIQHLWASDYDADTCRTYSRNIVGEEWGKSLFSSVMCEDIRNLDIDSLPATDAFAFGFPCNDFSIVGESKGLNGTYGPLYSYGVKYLRTHKPQWFVAENVGGLSSANEGKAFKLILKDLQGSGYKLVPNLYKFEQYGVPQARHRIIIVGIRDDLNITFKVPKPSHINNPNTAYDALVSNPIPEDAFNNEITRQSKTVVERLNHIAPGENAWSDKIPEHLRLKVKGAKLSNIYKRLDPNKPAYTVTGSGGGGTHMYHWLEPRALTNRERARLQTFPDDYIFMGSKESVRKQIGMAVPPQGMKVIFEAILKSFAGVEYEYTAPSIEIE